MDSTVLNDLDQKAHQAATSPFSKLRLPTAAQRDAGNYQKGHITLHGLDISIENPKGSTRSGTDSDGKAWHTKMQQHYGYLIGTIGADNSHIDVFVGDNHISNKVFVVDQIDPKTGAFDEHKVILGANSPKAARKIYADNYAKGWLGGKTIRETTIADFKAWLKDGNTKIPFSSPKPKLGLMKMQQAKAAKESRPGLDRMREARAARI